MVVSVIIFPLNEVKSCSILNAANEFLKILEVLHRLRSRKPTSHQSITFQDCEIGQTNQTPKLLKDLSFSKITQYQEAIDNLRVTTLDENFVKNFSWQTIFED